MDDHWRAHVGSDDYILFRPSKSLSRLHAARDGLFVGNITRLVGDRFVVWFFFSMCSAYLKQFSLPPITSDSFPMASQSHMIELVGQDTYVEVERAEVHDIAFVLPIFEVESGRFHMYGSYNSFFTQYMIRNGAVEQYIPKYYFLLRFIEPFSIRLFHSLNTLAGLLKKSFYHIGEAESCIHTFRLFFNTEAFCYLYHKLITLSFVYSKE
jgi:hypothetical protein